MKNLIIFISSLFFIASTAWGHGKILESNTGDGEGAIVTECKISDITIDRKMERSSSLPMTSIRGSIDCPQGVIFMRFYLIDDTGQIIDPKVLRRVRIRNGKFFWQDSKRDLRSKGRRLLVVYDVDTSL